MGSYRRVITALGIAGLLATAACGGGGGSEAGDPPGLGSAIKKPSLKPLEPSGPAVETGGFDECGLVEPSDIAAVLGVDAMYITSREVLPEADGGRLAGCSYFTEDVPGIVGMTINVVAGTDQEQFFRPFQERKVKTLDNFGDHAEVVAYEGGSVHFREVRAIEGTNGVHVRYTYNDSPEGMPNVDESDRLSNLLGGAILSVLNNLPDEITIADGAPEGPCADIDLAQASQVLGDELTVSRTVLGDDGAMNCQFAGKEASLGAVVVTDPGRVQSMRVPDELVNEPGIGSGAMVQIQPGDEAQGPLDATVNMDDRLVLVIADYGDGAGTVTEPRPEDTELVRTIVDAIA